MQTPYKPSAPEALLMKRILSRSLALAFCLLLPLLAMLGGCDRAPSYTLTLSAENSDPGFSTLMTATVTQNGVAAIGQNVAFTYTVEGGSPQSGPVVATNALGQATYMLENIDISPRTITVTAIPASDPKIRATADVRFKGFVALAESPMTWADAKAWCEQQGGRLPRINDSDSWAWNDRDKITRIEGFGAPGASWPSSLPLGNSWTGTESTGSTGGSWVVGVFDGNVFVNVILQSRSFHVVCVP